MQTLINQLKFYLSQVGVELLEDNNLPLPNKFAYLTINNITYFDNKLNYEMTLNIVFLDINFTEDYVYNLIKYLAIVIEKVFETKTLTFGFTNEPGEDGSLFNLLSCTFIYIDFMETNKMVFSYDDYLNELKQGL